MNLLTKRLGLVLAGLLGIGAIASLAIGASYALFSSTPGSQQTQFTAGTVTLTKVSTDTCTFDNMNPGDTSPTCSYTVDYTGSVQAFLLLNVSTSSQAGSGGTPLLDGTATGLQVNINDAAAADNAPGTGPNSNQMFSIGSVSCSSPTTCSSSAPDQEVLYNSSNTHNWVTYGQNATFDVSGYLPLTAGNGYQGGSATVTLTAWAIQVANNDNCGGSGSPCSPLYPVINSVTNVTPTSLQLNYNEPVQFNQNYDTHNGTVYTLYPFDWTIEDYTATLAEGGVNPTPDTCTVTGITTNNGGYPYQGNTWTLTFGACVGSAPVAGDTINFTYAGVGLDHGGGYVASVATPSMLAESPESFNDLTVG